MTALKKSPFEELAEEMGAHRDAATAKLLELAYNNSLGALDNKVNNPNITDPGILIRLNTDGVIPEGRGR